MKGVPTVCDACGWSGLAPGLIGGSAEGVTLTGNRYLCPECGKWARIVDGTYDLDDDVFTMRSGSDQSWREFAEIMSDERWTRERMERVQRAVASPGHGGKPEHVVEQVRRQDRELGDWLGRIVTDPRVQGAAIILIPLLSAVLGSLIDHWLANDAPPPAPTITQIVNQTVEVHSEQTPSPAPPSGDTESPTPTSTDPPQGG